MSGPVPDLSHPDVPLRIAPLRDPVIDALGHDPRSTYVERFWLVILGPAAVLLLRLFADELDHRPDGYTTTLPEVCQSLGLRFKASSENVVVHALERLCVLGLARLEPGNTLLVRRSLPSLAARQLHRLPADLRDDHRRWLDAHPQQPDHARQRDRARRLAVALVEMGDELDVVERQLHRWGYHPALAHDAIRWARAARLGGAELAAAEAGPVHP